MTHARLSGWMLLGIFVAGCGASTADRAAECPEQPLVAAPVSPRPEAPQTGPEEEPGPLVSVGSCDVGWLPPDMVADLTDEETASLVEVVREWLGDDGVRNVLIDAQRGISFAKSEDDRGDDPPYPTHTQAQGELVCGLHTRWLIDYVRSTLVRQATPDYGGVVCRENVCCFSGMEYMSSGYLIARRGSIGEQEHWVVDAYAEVAEAAMGEEHIQRSRAHVVRSLQQQQRRRSCRGEPPGFQ